MQIISISAARVIELEYFLHATKQLQIRYLFLLRLRTLCFAYMPTV